MSLNSIEKHGFIVFCCYSFLQQELQQKQSETPKIQTDLWAMGNPRYELNHNVASRASILLAKIWR